MDLWIAEPDSRSVADRPQGSAQEVTVEESCPPAEALTGGGAEGEVQRMRRLAEAMAKRPVVSGGRRHRAGYKRWMRAWHHSILK